MYSMTTGYGYLQLVARVPLRLDDFRALGASDNIPAATAGAPTKPIRNDTALSRTNSTYKATLCTLHMTSSTSVLLLIIRTDCRSFARAGHITGQPSVTRDAA